ncbi:hypothetical protein FM107_17930 [Sphingobacterium sp. JB170]|nr:hypothetical protein FM107_17930 [Sphingobacterium sp. JB170]
MLNVWGITINPKEAQKNYVLGFSILVTAREMLKKVNKRIALYYHQYYSVLVV